MENIQTHKNHTDKYALVTGASSGIGRYLSFELAKRGYSIVAVSNQVEALETLKSECENRFSISVNTICCDLTKENAAEYLFDFCQSREIVVDVLVNNAGILVYGEVIQVDTLEAKNILNLHMQTPVLLCKLFGTPMAANKHGYILNVSSISAIMPYPTISLYGPTKTFLRKFSRALRTEMKESGVIVSCLIPGATATPLHDPYEVDIPLALKLGVMRRPEFVAKKAMHALFKNNAECVPGIFNKLIMFLIPMVPNFIIQMIYKKTSRKEQAG